MRDDDRKIHLFPAHITRRTIYILKSDIDEDRRGLEKLCMRLRDPSCESIFLGGGESRVVGNDVEWHFDGQFRCQTPGEGREGKAGEKKAECEGPRSVLEGWDETRRGEILLLNGRVWGSHTDQPLRSGCGKEE